MIYFGLGICFGLWLGQKYWNDPENSSSLDSSTTRPRQKACTQYPHFRLAQLIHKELKSLSVRESCSVPHFRQLFLSKFLSLLRLPDGVETCVRGYDDGEFKDASELVDVFLSSIESAGVTGVFLHNIVWSVE